MRTDVLVWGILSLLLVAAEVLAPGAFLLWLGIAAGATCLVVLLVPGLPAGARVRVVSAGSMTLEVVPEP